MPIDQLVENVFCYRRKPLVAHAFISPFIVFYACWLGWWTQSLGVAEHWELGCIVIGAIFVAQVLTALFCYWFVEVDAALNCVRICEPRNAQMAKVKPMPNNGWTEMVPLQRVKLQPNGNGAVRIFFTFQKCSYAYDELEKQFRAILFDTALPLRHFQEAKGHDSDAAVSAVQNEYGNNRVEMEVPKFVELFIERATAPFFVFQVFCVGLWCLEDMWYYSLLTLFMLVTFEATIVKQQLKNMSEIRNMGSKSYFVNVYRAKRWNKISSDQLVCGDIVSICSVKGSDDERAIPCDLLLLRGNAICDEAMLTGESIPQMKEPLEEVTERQRVFDPNTDSRLHVLFGGTKMLQHTPPAKNEPGIKGPDNGVVCYVLRTGFNTQQGSLLRTIMFGVKRVSANNLETFFFILFLLIFAIVAAAYLWIKGTEDEERSRYKLFLECVLILTSVIPPELPIELSLAVNNSLVALQRFNIFCTEPFRIPFAGKVDMCCFDKTGTLTKDELVMEGVAGLPTTKADSPNSNGSTSNDTMASDSRSTQNDTTSSDTTVTVVQNVTECGPNTINALASCHSLVRFENDLVGDPLEKAILKWLDWNVTKQDAVMPNRRMPKMAPLKIFRRFHFTSQMKRMTVVAGYQPVAGSNDTFHIVSVKGAPEVLKPMFSNPPSDYDSHYQQLALAGARIVALGIRELGQLSHQQIREISRDELEHDLHFAGFAVISCPLKADSKQVIAEIADASHRVVMITGDNVLTAIHVAVVLRFIRRSRIALILDDTRPIVTDYDQQQQSASTELLQSDDDERNDNRQWIWRSSQDAGKSVALSTEALIDSHLRHGHHKFELCITGAAFEHLMNSLKGRSLRLVLQNVRVYARMSPKQKERAINALKAMGLTTLMCGDGTNDVGALKHADVGVALLTHPLKREEAAAATASGSGTATQSTSGTSGRQQQNEGGGGEQVAQSQETAKKLPAKTRRYNNREPTSADANGQRQQQQQQQQQLAMTTAGGGGTSSRQQQMQGRLNQMMRDLEDQEEQAKVRLGDASYAAPFTSKSTSIQSICNIIKQGRCTLVTTLQMFKILALNALVLAYSQSVLYLDGVKFSDTQATIQGIFLAACFLFISRSKPLKTLAKQRPMTNIFNVYTLSTITTQFAVHFACLIHIVRLAHALEERPGKTELEKEFKPNLLNTAVYLMSASLQIATFAVNYRGRPFMESLVENKPLFYSIICSFGAMVAFASNTFPDLNNKFELVHIPVELRDTLICCILGDLVCCLLLDRMLNFLFGDQRVRKMLMY
ncbi:hypothetical protein niasHT_008140 [Heterodera trifolii]|uniref:Uncharacterized protein n=1 Tax=Heterodera trifolii TaxID=157864 RepID=A0ABD2M023_9BILA